jgi:hypothetical protein
MKNKRGISGIVVALILVLLALVAAGIIWAVVRNVVESGTEEVSLGKFLIDLEIEKAYIEGNNLVVNVKRNAGSGDLTAINFVISNDSGSEVIKQDTDLGEYEEKSFNLVPQNITNLSSIKEISVVPVYKSAADKETLGSITDTYKVGEEPLGEDDGGSEQLYCGDGICSPGENCSTCETDCGACANDTGTCGDGVCADEEDCSTCSDDCGICPAYCGDGWCDPDEDCLTCETDCGTCECTPAPDPTLSGICGTKECGNAENGTCGTVSCGTCGSGYYCNPTGQCVIETAVNSGVIYSVWPADAPKYFESEDLPKSSEGYSYIGYYVKFPGSTETGCIIVTYFDYLAQNDRSYIRLDRVASIVPSDNYEIWKTEEGCEGM